MYSPVMFASENSKNYIIGYGSLMERESRMITNPQAHRVEPVLVRGFQRVWGQKQFEDELKMIFFQTGHADIWENIQKRVQEGEQAQREAQRRARDAAIKRAKKMAEMVNIAIGIGLVVLLVPPLIWLVIQGIMFAKDK